MQLLRLEIPKDTLGQDDDQSRIHRLFVLQLCDYSVDHVHHDLSSDIH